MVNGASVYNKSENENNYMEESRYSIKRILRKRDFMPGRREALQAFLSGSLPRQQ